MKNVLIIPTSLRPASNSHALALAFARGAATAGHHVETLDLHDKCIGFCRGCMACAKRGRCVIADDAPQIVARMHDADVIAFASPIYFYEMSGLMKTLLDRTDPLYGGDYRFRDIYLLTSAADDAPETPARATAGLEGWIACFERARLAGSVFAGGVEAAGDIANHPALETAYDMGCAID